MGNRFPLVWNAWIATKRMRGASVGSLSGGEQIRGVGKGLAIYWMSATALNVSLNVSVPLARAGDPLGGHWP